MKEKSSKAIVDAIKEEILPFLHEGDKLPTERELTEKYKVGRSVVREALLVLECSGLIKTKRGSGSVYLGRPSVQVSPDNMSTFFGPEEIGPFELIQARLVVECAVIRLAAKVATPIDIRELEQIYKEHEYNLLVRKDVEAADKCDAQFHIRIAETTHNMALVPIVKYLRTYVGKSEKWETFQEIYERDLAHMANSLAEHKTMLFAISRRDVDAAEKAMYDHIAKKVEALREKLDAKNSNVFLDDTLFAVN